MTMSSKHQACPNASSEGERSRYYIMDHDGSEASFEFMNEGEALIDGRSSGSHEVRPRGLNFVTHVGVPLVRETPRLKVGSRKRGKAPLDVYGNVFFSDRCKQLLCKFLPDDSVETIECDAHDLKGKDVGPYWWIDFIRVLDAVDEERSVFTRQIDNPFSSGEEADQLLYLDLQDIWFRPEIVGDAHIFRLSLATQFIIVDGHVADGIRSLGQTNIVLTPLQPPTPGERAEHWRFKNYPYWTNKESAA